MEDFEIVEMYWDRNENAITQTDRKYGKYCRKIAYSILFDREDTEECVNDTWLQTWNSIPPHRPERLSTYLGKICRNISINLFEKLSADKRGGTETDACLDEMAEVVGQSSDVEEQLDLSVLTDVINGFLNTMSVIIEDKDCVRAEILGHAQCQRDRQRKRNERKQWQSDIDENQGETERIPH